MERAWPEGREEAQDPGHVSMEMGSHGGLFARNNEGTVRGM